MRFPCFLLIILLLLSYACNEDKSTSDVPKNIVVQILSEPRSLHPVNSATSGASTSIRFFTTQRLTFTDPVTKALTPQLAAGLPEISDDGLRYTYEIDPAAKWGDGGPIVAEDILFSIKAATSPLVNLQTIRSVAGNIVDVEVDPTNDRKLTLVMRERYIANSYIVNDISILDKRFFDPEGLLDKFSVAEIMKEETTVGQDSNMIRFAANFNDAKYGQNLEFLGGTSGPYQVTNWIPQQQVILSKVDNYWGKGKTSHFHQQNTDKIIFKVITDDNSLQLQIKQQEIDVATRINNQSFESLLKNETAPQFYDIDARPRNSQLFVGYNNRPDGNRAPIFSDRKVRIACAFVCPIEDLIEDFYGGRAPRINSPVPISSANYHHGLTPLPFSEDSAKKWLDAAGWVDTDNDLIRDKVVAGEKIPLRFQLTFPAGSQTVQNMADLVIAAYEKVGMKVESNPVDARTLPNVLRNREFDAILTAFQYGYVPYDFKQLWTTGSLETRDNYFGFSNLELDKLSEEARIELDPARRKVLMHQIQEILYHEMPTTFICNLTTNIAIHKRFKDAQMCEMNPYVMVNALQE